MDSVKNRRSRVSQEDFEQCVNQMLIDNIEPSVTKVVKAIGGSFSTISPMFEQWNLSRKQSLYESAIPDFIKQASEKMSEQWWALVQSDVAERIQRVENDAQQRINELKLQCEEYSTFITDLEESLETKAQEIDGLTKSQAEAQQKYQSLVESSRLEREALKAEAKKEKDRLNTLHDQQIQREKASFEKMEKTLRELINEKDKSIQDLKKTSQVHQAKIK